MQTLTITQPDDWHLHVRDGATLCDVISATSRSFARAIIMPNLQPPVTTVELALAYRARILAASPANQPFEPLMTLYLTDQTTVETIHQAAASPYIHAVKLYPAGATTNSDSGVTDLRNVYSVLEAMQTAGMPLLIHGEVTDPDVDIFDREKVFIDTKLIPLRQDFPELCIVFEHITTADAAEYVAAADDKVAATITVHHLMLNRNAIFQGGLRPHHYCLPVLKRERHREALCKAASSGSPKFFLGTDSAPHPKHAKESSCGCAGVYSAPAALELYAEVFESLDALDKLEGFASFYGADFYGLLRNMQTVTLQKQAWEIPEHYPLGEHSIVPLRAGETVAWQQA